MSDREWLENYYRPLAGARVLAVRLEDNGFSEPVPVLTLQLAGEAEARDVGVMCDPEGNGPGFLDNLPMP